MYKVLILVIVFPFCITDCALVHAILLSDYYRLCSCTLQVWQHKTSGTFGSANLVVPEAIHEIVGLYVKKHRPTPTTPESSDLVFLTPQGRVVAHLTEDLRLLSKDFLTALGEMTMTSTQMRKLTSTHVAASGSTDDTIRKVAAHMTHGTDTARRYYQHMEEELQSIQAFDTIARKRSANKDEEPVVDRSIIQRRNVQPACTTLHACWSCPIIDSSWHFRQVLRPFHAEIKTLNLVSFSGEDEVPCSPYQ